MGWERRHGAGPYYIRTRKVHGQVVRIYFGKGPAAERAAAHDAQQRTVEATQKAVQRHLDALDREVTAWGHLIDCLTCASLLIANFHQHHRSEWRQWHGTTITC
jgi:hypothetical protein